MDISGFPSWAVGNLVDKRNRGIFAEWVVATALLNSELDSQKSVGVTTLNGLAESVTFSEIKTAVEKLV